MKRLLLILCTSILCLHSAYSQQGGFYIGGSFGYGYNGWSSRLTSYHGQFEEVTVGNSVSMDSSYSVSLGVVANNGIKIGMTYNHSNNISLGNGVVALESISVDFATYHQIYDHLYYCPEFNMAGVFGGVSSAIEFPILGAQVQLSLLQLEYRPANHFAITTKLLYADAYFLRGGDESILYEENILNASLCSSPMVSFKYYF